MKQNYFQTYLNIQKRVNPLQNLQSRLVVILHVVLRRRNAVDCLAAARSNSVIHSGWFRNARPIDRAGRISIVLRKLLHRIVVVPDDYGRVLRSLLLNDVLPVTFGKDRQPDGISFANHSQTESANLIEFGWHFGIVVAASCVVGGYIGSRGHRHFGTSDDAGDDDDCVGTRSVMWCGQWPKSI